MSKRTSFIGFLTVTVLVSLLVFACSKKDDANKADSNAPAETRSPAAQEAPLAEKVQTQASQSEPNAQGDSNKPELTKGMAEKETPFGVILAIAYSDKSSVLIGAELLHEGDTLRGVKIVKINEGTVEFEKNGKRWTQEAGETPNISWTEPNQ
jgi:hypothetical protein